MYDTGSTHFVPSVRGKNVVHECRVIGGLGCVSCTGKYNNISFKLKTPCQNRNGKHVQFLLVQCMENLDATPRHGVNYWVFITITLIFFFYIILLLL